MTDGPPDRTGVAERWAKIASMLLIPLVIAIVGWMVSTAQSRSEVNAQYVELAIDIMTSDASNDPGARALRDWAVKIISSKSGVSMTREAKSYLQEHVPGFVGRRNANQLAGGGEPEPVKVAVRAPTDAGQDEAAFTLLRVTESGTEEVEAGTAPIELTLEPGVYRVVSKRRDGRAGAATDVEVTRLTSQIWVPGPPAQ